MVTQVKCMVRNMDVQHVRRNTQCLDKLLHSSTSPFRSQLVQVGLGILSLPQLHSSTSPFGSQLVKVGLGIHAAGMHCALELLLSGDALQRGDSCTKLLPHLPCEV